MLVVPIIYMTAVGPWWWQEGRIYGQVIAYNPRKRYQSRLNLSPNMHAKSSFQITLQRINEAQAIQRQILPGKRVSSPSSSGSYKPISTAFADQRMVDQNHNLSAHTRLSHWLGKAEYAGIMLAAMSYGSRLDGS